MSASSYLPPETHDSIIDLLRDEPKTLMQCCLVAKSWVPRTRKHLFGAVNIRREHDLEAWKKTFPNPANSPAYHTHTLFVGCPQAVQTGDAEVGGWIRVFCNVVNLRVWTNYLGVFDAGVSLIPFHNFSPVLKSLQLSTSDFSRSRILNLVCSLPLLEDLAVMNYPQVGSGRGWDDSRPSTSPVLTGTLELDLDGSMEGAVRLLLSLPNGLHFRKLVLCRWKTEEHVSWTGPLVEACSDTLECVDLQVWNTARGGISLDFLIASLDFSNTLKLKEVIFQVRTLSAIWMTLALETITPAHRDFRQISIHVHKYYGLTNLIENSEEPFCSQWTDLDRLLVQFWESRGIRPKIVCHVGEDEEEVGCKYVECLFPELAKRGIIELVVLLDGL